MMDREIAATLNAEGIMSARGTPFLHGTVHLLRKRWGIRTVKINGVAAGAEHGDEDLRRPRLAGRRVDHRQRLPGEVDEQLVAGDVGLAHRQRHPPRRPAKVAEAAVAVALGVLGPVLLPQQQQRHPGAAQFGVDARPVGLRPQRLPRRERRAEQPRLQRGVVELGRHRSGDPDHGGRSSAAAAQRPEQVGVVVPAGSEDLPVGETTSADSRLSRASPYLPMSQPLPPPRVRPATPVDDTTPPVVASRAARRHG